MRIEPPRESPSCQKSVILAGQQIDPLPHLRFQRSLGSSFRGVQAIIRVWFAAVDIREDVNNVTALGFPRRVPVGLGFLLSVSRLPSFESLDDAATAIYTVQRRWHKPSVWECRDTLSICFRVGKLMNRQTRLAFAALRHTPRVRMLLSAYATTSEIGLGPKDRGAMAPWGRNVGTLTRTAIGCFRGAVRFLTGRRGEGERQSGKWR